jgi:integrase
VHPQREKHGENQQDDAKAPQTYWRAICVEAKVPKIRLHDARHTCGTLMHMQGVPIVVISAWLGHVDPAFTMRTYVHNQDEALKLAAATLQQVVSTSCQ